MEEGFVIDRGYGSNVQQFWAPGRPKPAFFGGIKIPRNGLDVVTWCCTKCGYLMDFVTPERQIDLS